MNDKLEELRRKWKKALEEERRLKDQARGLSKAAMEARTAADAAEDRTNIAYEELRGALESEP